MAQHEPFDLEAQERAQAEANERAKRIAKEEDEDFKWLMGSRRGRRIVHRFVDGSQVWSKSFDTNAMQMAFNEGRRFTAGILVNKLMSSCPDDFIKMMREHNDG